MADQNINYKITVDVESGTASLRDLQGRIVANQVPLQELRKEFGNLEKTVNAADFNKFKQGLDTISKSNINLKTSTGAATSATLELGRAISDAPYGIRGVANNLSQFASQFSFMSNTVDKATGKVVGFSGALKNLGRAIKANAILLVIQTIISAFDYFAGGAKKAEEANNDFLSSISDLVDVQGDLNDKVEEYLVLQKIKQELDSNQIKSNEKLKKIDDELLEVQKEKASANRLLILNQEKYNESIDKTTTRAKGYLNAQILNSNKLEELTKKENELNNERIDITGKYLEQLKDYRNRKNELTKADADSLKGLKEEKSQLEKRREILSKTSEDYKRLTIDIDNVQKKIEEIEGKQSKEKNGGKVKRDRVKALFDLPTPAEVLAYSKKLLDAVARGFGVDMKKNPLSIKPVLDLELTDEAKARIAAYNKSVNDELTLNRKLDNFSEYAELTRQALTSISDFTNAQYDRDLVIEQNKTTALNEELNQRLLNENLSKEERARIQNEIAINDEALRKKQNEIKKKQFNTQKAFNIASALVDTGRAAAGVMADAKGGFFTRLAQAIPTIAFGLAQVATIASQKFQPDAASTPIRTSGGGGSGGGMADRSFNFNLVGNNRENQLANAIQGQFNQPLKAYVVSRDMSNQQQLDANIVDSARF
jgi:hypothetical protein